MNGDLVTLKRVLSEMEGPAVDSLDKEGMSPLIISAASCYIDTNNRECFKCIASHGADLNIQERSVGKTALMLLASDGISDCIEHMQSSDSLLDLDLQDKFGDTALIKAARKGHNETVECLIRIGATVNIADQDGFTALFEAAKEGHSGCVQLLAAAPDVNLDIQDPKGCTAMMFACIRQHPDCVKVLVEAGAGKDIKTHDNKTAVYLSAYVGNFPVVKLLCESGADLCCFNDDVETAFQVAARKGHLQVADYIKSKRNMRSWVVQKKSGKSMSMGLVWQSRFLVFWADSGHIEYFTTEDDFLAGQCSLGIISMSEIHRSGDELVAPGVRRTDKMLSVRVTFKDDKLYEFRMASVEDAVALETVLTEFTTERKSQFIH